MARGTLAGLVFGGVAAVLGAGVISVLAPLPPSPDVAATDPSGATAPPEPGTQSGVSAAGRDPDVVEAAPQALPAGEERADDLTSVADADTQPAELPSVADQTRTLDAQPGTQDSEAPEIAAVQPSRTDTNAPEAPASGGTAGEVAPDAAADTDPAQVPSVAAETAQPDAPGTETPANTIAQDEAPAAATAPAQPAPSSDPDAVAVADEPDSPILAAPAISSAAPAQGAPGSEESAAGPSPAAVAEGPRAGQPDALGGETDPDTLASLNSDAVQPADRPRVSPDGTPLVAPGSGGASPDVVLRNDGGVGTDTPGLVPAAPGQEALPTAQAQSAKPEVAEAAPQAAPSAETEDAPKLALARDGTPAPADAGAVSEPRGEANPDVATAPAAQPQQEDKAPAQPAPGQPGDAAILAAPEQPVVAPASPGDSPATPAAAPQVPATTGTAEPVAPRIAALPQSGETAETGLRIGTPVVPLTERNRVEALPTTAAAAGADPAAASDAPPIERYAAGFDNPDNKPLMSIVLIDGPDAFGGEALQDFPYPLTFAVDPSVPDAAARMARHRAAGFEVMLLADLPKGATAQDAEVAMATWFDRMPETVGVLEGVGSGVQSARDLSDQVTAIAKGTGRGLVLQSNGLNTAQKLAARDGVPSAVVFRDFDGAGQTPVVIRRFLDQAAFRAGQEGAVIMLGRIRPDTISALLLWGLQDRASRVALAPVSAALTRSPDQ